MHRMVVVRARLDINPFQGLRTMKNSKRKQFAFRPSVTESSLENRLVLTGGTGGASASVAVLTPPTAVAPPGVAPAPAAPPISPQLARALLARTSPHLTLAKIHTAYNKQVRAATRDLRAAIQTQVGQLYANGATPTAQQIADFNASIAGALDATALRLSTQASLLPNAGRRLVPAIQNAILGSGPHSLVNRLSTLAQSGQLSGTSGASSQALTRLLNSTNRQSISRLGTFFNNTPINRLSVNTTGQHVPLQQFMGNQLLNQVANTFGALAQSFPNVANSVLFPNGTTGTPSQAALNTFNTMVNNALATAAFQLGSGLSVFPASSGVVSQLQPLLFGATNGTFNNAASSAATGIGNSLGSAATGIGNSLGSAATGIGNSLGSAANGIAGNTASSLAAALQNLPFGSTGFNTAVNNAFGTAFQNLVTPLGQFLGMNGVSNLALPSSGFTSPFGTAFSGSSFFNGFNNGFANGTTPGFIGFGTAPTSFNTNFGTGFNNAVTSFNQNMGLAPGTTGSLLPGGVITDSTGLQGGIIVR
jgi:hypothetical protein